MTLERYAYTVAGPREFVVVAIINGLIAWLLFRQEPTVSLFGSPAMAEMLGPMSFLLPALTTFFGIFNAVRVCRQNKVMPALNHEIKWLKFAVQQSIAIGAPICITVLLLLALLRYLAWNPAISSPIAMFFIAFGSAACAFFLHARAVLLAARL